MDWVEISLVGPSMFFLIHLFQMSFFTCLYYILVGYCNTFSSYCYVTIPLGIWLVATTAFSATFLSLALPLYNESVENLNKHLDGV
jgi:hypothetical protein